MTHKEQGVSHEGKPDTQYFARGLTYLLVAFPDCTFPGINRSMIEKALKGNPTPEVLFCLQQLTSKLVEQFGVPTDANIIDNTGRRRL